MSNIAIRFLGTADFTQANAELLKTQRLVAGVNAEMNKMATQSFRTTGLPNAQQYRAAEQATASMSSAYRAAASSTGMFEVSQEKVNSATARYTELLQKQKLSLGEMIRERKVMNAVYAEQLRLERMSVMGWRTDMRGNMMADITVPKALPSELDTLGRKIGFVSTMARSASVQMVNWGKQMQWAGRQLMVGFTLPVAAAAAGMGVLAYRASQDLTRITKVYDTTNHANMSNMQQAAAKSQELAQVQADAMNVAKQAAAQYGASMNDTLNIAADLAATGLKGSELMASTTQVMRIATLGEMDYNTALNATISMQSVFHDNAKQLGEDFNYMNAVENATSLQLSDFAAAIPIAAAPIKEMGGDIRTLGTLLVAMRSQGIQAVQGANAIKSAVGRIFNPSQKVQDSFQALTGISLEDIRTSSNEQIIPIFEKISAAIKPLTADQKIGLMSQLFGTYQRTRLMAIIHGLDEIGVKGTQAQRATEIAGQSAAKNLAIANGEIAQMAESAAGRFKRTIESLKVQLAEMGKPFLEFGASVLNVLTSIITKFNELPGGVKRGLAITAIIIALIGPATMMVGLFMNMVGTITRFAAAMTGLVAKFPLFTRLQRVSNLLAEASTSALEKQTMATSDLSAEMTALAASIGVATSEMGKLVSIQEAEAAASMKTAAAAEAAAEARAAVIRDSALSNPNIWTGRGSAYTGGAIAPTGPPGTTWLRGEPVPKEQVNNMRMMAISGGLFAAAMAASMVSSSKTVDNITKLIMVVALLGPAIAAIGPIIMRGIVTGLLTASALVTDIQMAFLTGGLRQGIVNAGNSMRMSLAAGLTSALGIGVALAAAGYGMYKLWQNSKKGSEEMDHMYNSADQLSKIIGYTVVDNASVDSKGQTTISQASKVEEFRKAYGDVVDRIRAAQSEQAKFNVALVQGMKVINSGGTADQAREAVKLALAAATNEVEANHIVLRFDAQLNFEDPKVVAQGYANSLRDALDNAMGSTNDKSFFEKNIRAGSWKDFAFGGFGAGQDSRASDASVKAGESAADAFMNGWNTALTSNSDQMKEAMLNSLDANLQAMNKHIHEALAAGNTDEAQRLVDLRSHFLSALGDNLGIPDLNKILDGTKGLADAMLLVTASGADVSKTLELQYLRAKQAAGSMTAYDRQLLFVLTHQKQLLGIAPAVTGFFQNLFGVTNQSSDANANNTTTVNNNAAALRAWEAHAKAAAAAAAELQKAQQDAYANFDFGGALKGAMQSTQQTISGMITDQFQADEQAAMDSLQKQGEQRLAAMDAQRDARLAQYDREEKALQAREDAQTKRLEAQQQAASDAFDKRWTNRMDQVTKSYDAQIAAVQRQMDAEQKQEQQRQAIFDAQVARIQQLADMANRNIDFNVALNSGNLDEAAKVRNDADAALQSALLGKAGTASQSASDAEQARLQKTMDQLNKQKDTQLANLQKVEDAQRKALEAEQQRQQDALKREQQNLEDSLAAQRAHYEKLEAIRRTAAEQDIQQNQDAEQKIWDLRKQGLDRALEAFNSYIPTSQAKLQQWIDESGKRYGEFGKMLKENGGNWATIIGNELDRNIKNSANSLRTDVDWAGIATSAIRQMASAFGFKSIAAFQRWAGINVGNTATPPPDNIHRPGVQIPSSHDGGSDHYFAGRSGFPAHGALYPQEVLKNIRKDEYVVDHRTHQALGTPFFDGLKAIAHTSTATDKPPVGGAGDIAAMGMVSMMGIGLAKMFGGTLRDIAQNKFMAGAPGQFGTAAAGKYGDEIFSADQLANAAIVASVGKSVGASIRDITVALMAAMVESNLQNLPYGDADSIGMFQQRAAWGSYAQRIDPSSAARMFFLGGHQGQPGLLDYPERNAWSLGAEAQKVQVSAFPDRYAEKANEAEAIIHALMAGSAGYGGQGPSAGGGLFRPVRGGYISQGLHDQDTGFPAIDIGIPVGSPVYAGAGGRVVVSKDLRGYESRIAHQNGYYSYGKYMEVETPFNGTQLYAHLQDRGFQVGAMVRGGQQIGVSGLTGHTYGPHLHFGSSGTSPYAFLRDGGTIKWDNTPALLHKREKVLTEPLSDSLVAGIRKMEQGHGGDLTINNTIVATPGMDEEALTRKVVTATMKAIDRKDSKTGRGRTVGVR